jgi:hypothetical protein
VFPLGSIQTPGKFCRITSKRELFPWIIVEYKSVEFTLANGLVENPVVESPTTHACYHRTTAVITSSLCPTPRKRKCKILKRAREYFKKKKYIPRSIDTTG